MDIYTKPRRARISDADAINGAIAQDIRDRRMEAGVTLVTLADLFDEKKASVNKYEARINQINVAKYLAIIHFLRETCPNHPAHTLIEAIGPRNLEGMLSHERPAARLAGFLDMIDLTRKTCPNHPALPLANYFLYERG
jgi:hypothetical protein